MAPKGKQAVKQLVAPTKTIPSIVVSLNDVSLEASSGWRGLDSERVSELKATFRRDEYGLNLLRKPTLLAHGDRPKLTESGLKRLADGKHTFAALRE